MSGLRRRVASMLLEAGAAVLPAARREWGEAMRAEAAHLGEREVLGFAAGCLLACLGERLHALSAVPAPVRGGLAAALLLYAAFAARSALRMAEAQPPTAAVFAGVAAAYALAALWVVLRRGLAEAATVLLVLNLTAAAGLRWPGLAGSLPLDGALVSALAVEGVVIGLAVLGTCLACTQRPAA
ncbi:hypothetical protein [Methylobacterium oryzisoli]|uniref:hypothetical protein n=1 Tax=Methylobacterium oryzisoli TaxID=3385502 RepID=UPI003892089D